MQTTSLAVPLAQNLEACHLTLSTQKKLPCTKDDIIDRVTLPYRRSCKCGEWLHCHFHSEVSDSRSEMKGGMDGAVHQLNGRSRDKWISMHTRAQLSANNKAADTTIHKTFSRGRIKKIAPSKGARRVIGAEQAQMSLPLS